MSGTIIEESYSYCMQNLLSDFGGILGFYIGMSVLTICEIFDFIVKIFETIQTSRIKPTKTDSQLVTENENVITQQPNSTNQIVIF